MDDNRPELQRMIERATDGDHPFDVIVVHSYSRFFRDPGPRDLCPQSH